MSALGELLELCRPYLLKVANEELAPDLYAKGGGSDLVQETFLEAQRDFGQFQGMTKDELVVWLRQILRNNLANFARRYHAAKRRISAEKRMLSETSSVDWRAVLTGDTSSPSSEVRFQEQAALLEQALQRLPDHYRQVIWLRHREDHSFKEIGTTMHCSAEAARKLWSRAVRRLKLELADGDSSSS